MAISRVRRPLHRVVRVLGRVVLLLDRSWLKHRRLLRLSRSVVRRRLLALVGGLVLYALPLLVEGWPSGGRRLPGVILGVGLLVRRRLVQILAVIQTGTVSVIKVGLERLLLRVRGWTAHCAVVVRTLAPWGWVMALGCWIALVVVFAAWSIMMLVIVYPAIISLRHEAFINPVLAVMHIHGRWWLRLTTIWLNFGVASVAAIGLAWLSRT